MEQLNTTTDLNTTDLNTTVELNNLTGIVDVDVKVKPDLSISRLRKAAELNKVANHSTRAYVNDCIGEGIAAEDIVNQVRKQLAASGLWLVSTTGKYKDKQFHLSVCREGDKPASLTSVLDRLFIATNDSKTCNPFLEELYMLAKFVSAIQTMVKNIKHEKALLLPVEPVVESAEPVVESAEPVVESAEPVVESSDDSAFTELASRYEVLLASIGNIANNVEKMTKADIKAALLALIA